MWNYFCVDWIVGWRRDNRRRRCLTFLMVAFGLWKWLIISFSDLKLDDSSIVMLLVSRSEKVLLVELVFVGSC